MAKKELTIEDSPFFVKYTGITKGTKTYGYHVKKDFENHLKQFLDARFGSDASDTEMMEKIVADYYFRYAHERTYYKKTIVALFHKQELESDDPTIIPMMVLDRHVKDYKNNMLIDENVISNSDSPFLDCVAVVEPFNNVDADLQKNIVSTIFSDGFDIDGYDVFKKLENFNEDLLKDFFVLEIPLNNYLDAYLNGVYCYEHNGVAVESMHVGLAIVIDSIEDTTPIPIVYRWNLESNFAVSEFNTEISKVSLDEMHKLCVQYNQIMFAGLKFFEMYNINDKDKLRENRQKQARLEDELAMLKQQEKLLVKSVNDDSNRN